MFSWEKESFNVKNGNIATEKLQRHVCQIERAWGGKSSKMRHRKCIPRTPGSAAFVKFLRPPPRTPLETQPVFWITPKWAYLHILEILREAKFSDAVARYFIYLKYTTSVRSMGLAPNPTGVAYSAPQTLSWISGAGIQQGMGLGKRYGKRRVG